MSEEEILKINDLISRIAANDFCAVDELYGLFGGRLLAVAFSYVKNRMWAEDVLHDAFIKITCNSDKFRANTNGYSWMCKIVRNTALDKLRREKRRAGEDIDNFGNISSAEDTAKFDRAISVELALNRLADNERKIICLIYFEDITLREAAKRMKISKSAAGRLLLKAEENLKNQL